MIWRRRQVADSPIFFLPAFFGGNLPKIGFSFRPIQSFAQIGWSFAFHWHSMQQKCGFDVLVWGQKELVEVTSLYLSYLSSYCWIMWVPSSSSLWTRSCMLSTSPMSTTSLWVSCKPASFSFHLPSLPCQHLLSVKKLLCVRLGFLFIWRSCK